MEKIIVVEKSEVLQGSKGDYLKVTGKDGKVQNIFDSALWNLFGDDLAVKLTLEQQGRWWNVTAAEGVAKELAEKVAKETPQTADDLPFPKHPLTLAVEYWTAKIAMGTDCKINDVLEVAEIFKGYLKGEIKPDVTRIIAALMRPAKELKKED